MPLFHFSEEFKARVREAIMPISVRVKREVRDSPDILIEEIRCERCGKTQTFSPPRLVKATGIHDCEWTHEYVWETGERCGGQFLFVTSPVMRARFPLPLGG